MMSRSRNGQTDKHNEASNEDSDALLRKDLGDLEDGEGEPLTTSKSELAVSIAQSCFSVFLFNISCKHY